MTYPTGTRVIYYKFLLPGRITPVQKSKWPVRVGAWTPKANPILCESGWHASEAKDLLNHLPSEKDFELWEVEGRGAMVVGDDKAAFEQMKLVRLVRAFDARNLRLYACAMAEDVLPIFEKKYPKDNRPREAIEVSRRFANGEATREELDATRAAARDATWAAAWAAARAAARDATRDAAWAAARDATWAAAWDAARAAAWAATWDAARDAAWDAAWAATWDAAWDAARAAARAAARDAAWDAARDAARGKYSRWMVEGWPE